MRENPMLLLLYLVDGLFDVGQIVEFKKFIFTLNSIVIVNIEEILPVMKLATFLVGINKCYLKAVGLHSRLKGPGHKHTLYLRGGLCRGPV